MVPSTVPPTVPPTMRALVIPKYGKPDTYGISSNIPTPVIKRPDEILIRARAASINPIDVKMAVGVSKMIQKDTFPYLIGYDVAGEVVAVGTAVTHFKPGDAVYSRVPNTYKGSVADYVLSPERAVARKPDSLSYIEAASIPLAGLTAFQCLRKADSLLEGGLKGKTVLIPAGLSGTGSFAIQLAKNVFKVDTVLTTLSTQKIVKAQELFGADAFRAIDYTKEDVAKTIGRQSVDYLFDTMSSTLSLLGTMKKGGVICSISTLPSGKQMKAREGTETMPFYIGFVLDVLDYCLRWWTRTRAGVSYSFVFMEPKREDIDMLSEFVSTGLLSPVIGRTAKLSDEEAVIQGCQQIYDGKGGIGKFVIEID